MAKTLAEYLALPYTVEVTRNEDGFFARVEELPGCITWADRIEDLWPMIEDAKHVWIEDALEDGDPVPEPALADERSDRVPIRMPETLHRQLQQRANEGGMTLDQFVTGTLARAVGE